MGEGDAVSEKSDAVANGNAEAVLDEKIEHHDGVKEIEVDKHHDELTEIEEDKHNDGEKGTEEDRQHDGEKATEEDKQDNVSVEAQNMDVDKDELSKSSVVDTAKEERKEENQTDTEEQETGGKAEEEKSKSEEIEEDAVEETKNTADDKVEEEVDGMDVEENNQEEPNKERKIGKRSRTKISAGKNNNNKKKLSVEKEKEPKTEEKEKEPNTEKKEKEPKTPKEKKITEPKTSVYRKEKESKTSEDKKLEPKTPAGPTPDRPVRERKSVERLVAVIEKDHAKEFHIEKGPGTALKDIPNVAFKLSRKKNDDTLKLLHTILFGRRGKAAQVKNNISRFSGFVWHDNEEKQSIKVKEKLDKCIKEKLFEFCNIFDIPISRANSRKEDIVAKLFEFLVAPHATSSKLLADTEQSSKGKKRKRVSKPASGSTTPSVGSHKSRKKTGSASKKGSETRGTPPESEDESDEEEEENEEEANEEEGVNGVPEKSDDEMSEHAESEEKENESEEESDKGKGKQKQKRGSVKSSAKRGFDDKAKTKNKSVSKKASPPPKKAPAKSSSSQPKSTGKSSAKESSGKKKDDLDSKSPTPKKSVAKESTGKKILKVKEKLTEERLKPTDDKLRDAICEILKEVDFNTATFTDILKLLTKQFNTDLTPRKSSIKVMIQEELTKLADADEEDEEEDEGDVDKDKGVKA